MIEGEVETALKEFERTAGADPNLLQLREFYERMKTLGIAQTQEYGLPPIDTVGVTAFRENVRRG